MEYQSKSEVEAIRKRALKLKALIHHAVVDGRFRIGYKAANEGHAGLTLPERRRLLRSSDRKCRMIASTSTLCDDGKSFD